MPNLLIDKRQKLKWFKYTSELEFSFERMAKDLKYDDILVEESEERLNMLKKVNTFYKFFYSKIKEELKNELSAEDVLSIVGNTELELSIHPFTFRYLIRDWGLNKKYDQRQKIVSFLSKKLNDLNVFPADTALFLGCGSGRYPVDLAHYYKKIDAFDSSLPMIWSILNLKKIKKWRVLHKIEKNCRKISDTYQDEELVITDEQIRIIDEKINFFVGDLNSIELHSSSVNHIYSIYFTDVFPLKLLLTKIDFLLKNYGLFVHFGPLDYFFTNENEMLTAEEVKSVFIKNNYKVLADEYFSTRHIFMEKSMSHQVYDNWFFVAQKTPKQEHVLNLESKVLLNGHAKLLAIGSIANNKKLVIKYSVSTNERAYEIPEIIYHLLSNIKQKNSLKTVFKKLELENLKELESKKILEILQELFDSNMLKLQ